MSTAPQLQHLSADHLRFAADLHALRCRPACSPRSDRAGYRPTTGHSSTAPTASRCSPHWTASRSASWPGRPTRPLTVPGPDGRVGAGWSPSACWRSSAAPDRAAAGACTRPAPCKPAPSTVLPAARPDPDRRPRLSGRGPLGSGAGRRHPPGRALRAGGRAGRGVGGHAGHTGRRRRRRPVVRAARLRVRVQPVPPGGSSGQPIHADPASLSERGCLGPTWNPSAAAARCS